MIVNIDFSNGVIRIRPENEYDRLTINEFTEIFARQFQKFSTMARFRQDVSVEINQASFESALEFMPVKPDDMYFLDQFKGFLSVEPIRGYKVAYTYTAGATKSAEPESTALRHAIKTSNLSDVDKIIQKSNERVARIKNPGSKENDKAITMSLDKKEESHFALAHKLYREGWLKDQDYDASPEGTQRKKILALLIDQPSPYALGAGRTAAYTPLTQAVASMAQQKNDNDREKVKNRIRHFVIDLGANVAAKDGEKNSALHAAIRAGDIDLIKFLLNLAEDNKVPNKMVRERIRKQTLATLSLENIIGETPVVYARSLATPDIEALLNQAKENLATGKPAVATTQTKLAAQLITTAQPKPQEVKDDLAELQKAVLDGDLGTTSRVITNFGNKTAQKAAMTKQLNEKDDTILHIAGRKGKVQIIQLLLASGADKGALNAAGQTPYEAAMQANVKEEALSLLAAVPVAHQPKAPQVFPLRSSVLKPGLPLRQYQDIIYSELKKQNPSHSNIINALRFAGPDIFTAPYSNAKEVEWYNHEKNTWLHRIAAGPHFSLINIFVDSYREMCAKTATPEEATKKVAAYINQGNQQDVTFVHCYLNNVYQYMQRKRLTHCEIPHNVSRFFQNLHQAYGLDLSTSPHIHPELLSTLALIVGIIKDTEFLKIALEEWIPKDKLDKELNGYDFDGETLLQFAARFSSAKVCKVLLEKGANPDILTLRTAMTVQQLAAENRHDPMVRSLFTSNVVLKEAAESKSSASTAQVASQAQAIVPATLVVTSGAPTSTSQPSSQAEEQPNPTAASNEKVDMMDVASPKVLTNAISQTLFNPSDASNPVMVSRPVQPLVAQPSAAAPSL